MQGKKLLDGRMDGWEREFPTFHADGITGWGVVGWGVGGGGMALTSIWWLPFPKC